MKVIDCRCNRVLGIMNDDGSVTVKHSGKEVNCWPPLRIKCHRCHFTKAIDRAEAPVVQ